MPIKLSSKNYIVYTCGSGICSNEKGVKFILADGLIDAEIMYTKPSGTLRIADIESNVNGITPATLMGPYNVTRTKVMQSIINHNVRMAVYPLRRGSGNIHGFVLDGTPYRHGWATAQTPTV